MATQSLRTPGGVPANQNRRAARFATLRVERDEILTHSWTVVGQAFANFCRLSPELLTQVNEDLFFYILKMNTGKKNAAAGAIAVHIKSQEATEATETVLLPSTRSKGISGCFRGDHTKDGSSRRPKDRLHHTLLRQLQVKMEAENQQAKKTIPPLLDTGFMKELELFLSQWDVAQLRRKELLHKRWTERVWLPLQRRVEEHVSSCGPVEAERRQSLYSQYIGHCNSKGFVFLDTYDPAEYNPFLLCKMHERHEGHRMSLCCKAGRKCTRKPQKPLPQSGRPLVKSGTSRAKSLLASYYPASKPPAEGKESSRLCTIPYHVLATATADGRCHKRSCWFSRCGPQQPAPGLQEPQSLSMSK
ncbi:protein FAM228A isoform X2 [Betta splendens]|uniref:Protein FAM228A isoform X2 n=2 Tax=Betta splendens TaxID=158456 RepID=A0A6P7LPI1_BETSP|nr:protein FAM228A isoform X2 [Betta splendens]